MLDSLAPARRRFVLGIAALLGLAVAVIAATGLRLLGGEPDVDPVPQSVPGPVLLVPGYGGSTGALEVLAEALEASGRTILVVPPVGAGTGDLRAQAEALDRTVTRVVRSEDAASIDVVGYSAGGVVARLWVADHGGGSVARRVVTLASPHHGTDLASLAGDLAPESCPEACHQLAEDSDLLRELNAGDETPVGPRWVTIWTADDRTVVPPESGALEGALDVRIQSVCPGLQVTHGDVPSTPAVIAMVAAALGAGEPRAPDPEVCAA